MKPEILLLLKLQADQYALSLSIREAVVPLYLQIIKGVPKEMHQQIEIGSLSDVRKNATEFLRAFLEFLEKYYPSTFVSESGKKETVDELIRKISLLSQNSDEN